MDQDTTVVFTSDNGGERFSDQLPQRDEDRTARRRIVGSGYRALVRPGAGRASQ
jgi:arylsulfatase A-like enzyme